MKEDYVSFEIAKLLKEKGFREWCRECYGTDVRHNGVSISFDEELDLKDEGRGDEIEYVEGGIMHNISCNNSGKDMYAAPTLSIAMKWLREIHNIDICICIESDNHGNCFNGYVTIVYNNRIYKVTIRDIESNLTYESACERAIKYCLTNLL